MKSVPFTKYTAFGNNFVIVDETEGPVLTESEKSNFAFHATNTSFGIGSDNLIVIQNCSEEVLASINVARGYWDEAPDPSQADLVFRMLEPDGKEAFSCGNGLMSIATYLSQRYGIPSTRILTEIPFSTPRPVSIGRDPQNEWSWANLGVPRRVPGDIVEPSLTSPYDDRIDHIEKLAIPFRRYDLTPYTENTTLDVSGYLVFTGEPHFVMFPEEVFPEAGLVETVFPRERARVRRNFGSWLVHRIGSCINKEFPDLMPRGLNVNFARVTDDRAAVEYRCFERGINRETLACGTGALAVACVCRALGSLTGDTLEIRPHRCRLYDPGAAIRVHEEKQAWVLSGRPKMLCHGWFPLEPADTMRPAGPDQSDHDAHDCMLCAEIEGRVTASAAN